MSESRPYHALFLCTGNSARSIMAECALNRRGGGRFRAFSAGSHPQPAPHPLAIELLRELDYDVGALRSKSWDEFARPGSPRLDFVVTVCDRARGEACPVWPGQPITAHWGCEDPAAYEGPVSHKRRRFRRVYAELESRIEALCRLPIASLDRATLCAEFDRIAEQPGRSRS